ncbi:MAG: DUF998 domain-containing protein [Jatrophihabitantaceae bacterium]
MLVAGVIDLFGAGVTLSAMLVLHVVRTGLSPVRNAVSQYGISYVRVGYRVLTLAMAAAGAAGAVGVGEGLHAAGGAVVAALAVFAATRAAISWVPMDDPSTPATRTGRRDGLLAVLTFLALAVAALRLGSDLRRTHEWIGAQAWTIPLDAFLVLGLVAMVITRRAPGLRGYFGAAERLYYLGVLAWLSWLGVALIANR